MCVSSLHQTAEVVRLSVLKLHLKVKRPANPRPSCHTGKVHRGNGVKLDIDGRFVDKDEPFVQRVEVTRGGSTGA